MSQISEITARPATKPFRPGPSGLVRCFSPTITIALGGNFNAGKTSLANVLSGANLPTSRLPETAAPAYIRAGSDVARHSNARQSDFAPVIDHSRVASLYNCNGQRNSDVPDRFDVTVPDGALPAGFSLIDTPGCNDEPAITKRAMLALSRADHVVWVTSSLAPLSEQHALRELASRRGGWEGLTLVLNVFLERADSAHWHEFTERDLQVMTSRISQALEALGAQPDQVPIFALCACAPTTLSDKLGIGPFREWLFDRERQVQIARASRSARLDMRRRHLDEIFSRQLGRANSRLTQAKNEWVTHKAQAKNIVALQKAVRAAVDLGFENFEDQAKQISEQISASVSCPPLRDSTYQDAMTAAFRADPSCREIIIAIDQARDRIGLPRLDEFARGRLRVRFPRFDQKLAVADTPMKKGIMAAGLAGWLAGPLVFAATMTAAVATSRAQKNAMDQKLTRDVIFEAGAAMVAYINESLRSFRDLAIDVAVPALPESPQPIEPLQRRITALEKRRMIVESRLNALAIQDFFLAPSSVH